MQCCANEGSVIMNAISFPSSRNRMGRMECVLVSDR
jgi:hypothetical protein